MTDDEAAAEDALAYFEDDVDRFGEVITELIRAEAEVRKTECQALTRAETDLARGLIGVNEVTNGWLVFREPTVHPDLAARWDSLAVAAGINLAELALYRRFDTKRKPIGRVASRAVWDRDGWECVHCGSHRDLTVDHVIPVALGGTNDMDNLQTLCRPCNSSKGARTTVGASRPRLVIV